MSFGFPSTLRHQVQFLIVLMLLPIVGLIVWNAYAAREFDHLAMLLGSTRGDVPARSSGSVAMERRSV